MVTEMPKNSTDERALIYARLCVSRAQGRGDEGIAAELGHGSPGSLYEWLAEAGFPICRRCGETVTAPDHCQRLKKRRRRPSTGLEVQLPPARGAHDLFREALRELESYLDLVYIEESSLRGRLFTTYNVDRDQDEVLHRASFSQKRWEELCERHGADPDDDELRAPVGSAGVGRVGRAPSYWLIALIGAYALADRPLTPLLESLYPPDLDPADKEDVREKAAAVRDAADHLATMVRGDPLGKGNRPKEVHERDVFAAWLIRSLEESDEETLTDEKVLAKLKEKFPDFAAELTVEDIHRMRHLGLQPPR